MRSSCRPAASSGAGKSLRSKSHSLMCCRIFAGFFILVVILLVNLWVPLALADNGTAGDTGQGQTTLAHDSVTTTSASTSSPASVVPRNNTGVSGDTSTASGSVPASSGSSDLSGVAVESKIQQAGGSSAAPDTNAAPAGSGSTPSNQTASPAVTSHDEDEGEDEQSELKNYELHLICGQPYWASQDDYNNHLLSVDYLIGNTGSGKAKNVRITSATATNGVTAATPIPISLGDLDPGDWITTTIKWLIKPDTTRFNTTITVCASCEEEDENDGDHQNEGSNGNDDDNNGNDSGGDQGSNGDNKDSEGNNPIDDPIDNPNNGGSGDNNNGDQADLGTLINVPNSEAVNPAPGVPAPAVSTLVTDRAALPSTGFDLPLVLVMSLGLVGLGVSLVAVQRLAHGHPHQ